MIRHLACAIVLLAALSPGQGLSADLRSGIIPEPVANRHGLTRPWFTQIQLDPGRTRLDDIVLYDGVLYAQTDHAMVHAADAETGATLWAKQIGRPNHPSMTPAAHGDLLAVVNGSRLYVCNRFNGDILYEVQVDGAPGAGAALSDKRAYVPMISGMVMAYRLEPATNPLAELGKPKEDLTEAQIAAAEKQRREDIRLRQEYIPPLACQSFGHVLVPPLVTEETLSEEFVVWPTDRGHLNIAQIDRRREDCFAVKYRLDTGQEIASRPAYLPPDPNVEADSGIVFVASRDGYVYAVRQRNGKPLWQLPTGEPVIEPVVLIGQSIYVCLQLGGMYCLEAKTGSETWWAPQVRQFLAASPQRVYAADKLGSVLILDTKTGARLDTLDATASPIKLINSQTDRLYLATDTGLIQCLRELELEQPIHHVQAPAKPAETNQPAAETNQPAPETKQPAAEQPQDQKQPAEKKSPPGGAKKPPAENKEGDKNAEEEPSDAGPDNPFD